MPNAVDDIAKRLQDAAYVGIGLSVIAFQKVQVQRQELNKSLQGTIDGARARVEDNVRLVEERLRSIAER